MSRRPPLQPNAALAEMMARDFGDRPFGRFAGEMAQPERSAPAPRHPRRWLSSPRRGAENAEPNDPEESAA